MFNVGDIIKVKLDVAHEQFQWCQNTTVYTNMMKLATEKRYKIIGDSGPEYEILHVGFNVQNSHPKAEIHELFELANDDEDKADSQTT